MINSSIISAKYLSLLESTFDCYVADWTKTTNASSIYPIFLFNLKSDRGRFIPTRVVHCLLSATTTATANITNVGLYTTTPSIAVDSTISNSSVVISSTTILPGSYVMATLITAAGTSSISAGASIGLDYSIGSTTNTVSVRTWMFGIYV